MTIHQFTVSKERKRLVITQSKTEPGIVLVQIRDRAGLPLECFAVDAPTAAVIGQAFELEAVAAENSGLVEVAGRRCGCGNVFPKCGASHCAGSEIKAAQKAVQKIATALVKTCADNFGRALPVVDVQQVDAPGAAVVRDVVDGLDNDLNAAFFNRRASDCGAEKVGA